MIGHEEMIIIADILATFYFIFGFYFQVEYQCERDCPYDWVIFEHPMDWVVLIISGPGGWFATLLVVILFTGWLKLLTPKGLARKINDLR